MRVHQIYLNNALRNFNYLVEMEEEVFCIDPFDVEKLSAKLKEIGKPLKAIINTHEHWDHIGGNEKMKSLFQCPLWAPLPLQSKITGVDRWLKADEVYGDEKEKLCFTFTPGHTLGHFSLFLESMGKVEGVIVGDTIFTAGVGNCHNGGDPSVLYETISNLFMPLCDDVKIFSSHDYASHNLQFSLQQEPSNKHAKELLAQFSSGELDSTGFVSTIGLEKKVNCFFRLRSLELVQSLSMEGKSDKEVFLKLRELRNNW